MTLARVPIWSPNYSGRGGSDVTLVVVHTAQGASTFTELGNFFANPSSGVSSHVGIDSTPGTVGEYVLPQYKSWTAASFNPMAIQAEVCAWAEWSYLEWMDHPTMLENTAEWIREECERFGLPIVKLSAEQAQGGFWGVCGHADLGAAGGGHWDPGPGFPWDDVMEMAAGGRPNVGPPSEVENEEVAIVVSQVVTHRFNQLSCFQASGGQLWHKYSQDGGQTWRSDPLIRPNGNPVKGTVKDTVSVSVVAGDVYVSTEDTEGFAWMCRQSDDITTGWDIRRMP